MALLKLHDVLLDTKPYVNLLILSTPSIYFSTPLFISAQQKQMVVNTIIRPDPAMVQVWTD